MEADIIRIRERISSLEAEVSALIRVLKNEEMRNRERMNSYTHKVKVFDEGFENERLIVISTINLNIHSVHKEHIRIFGIAPTFPAKRKTSKDYYREQGIIFSKGSGYNTLKD